ncbi:MAG: peptidoglycan-binding protein, partial [Candidatus Nitrotoga sp.]
VTIKNPHWIYPGDVVHLDRASGTLHVGQLIKANATTEAAQSDSVKLSPRVHVQSSEHNAIPSISANAIESFLSRPLIIEKDGLSNAPVIVGSYEKRVLLASGDIAYAKGLANNQGLLWQIYRPGKTLVDPDTKEVLGYEAVYLGDAAVEKFDDISTLKIVKALNDINKGDRLIQASPELAGSFVPRAPDGQIAARVISIYAGVSQGGQHSIVTLNKGLRDGLKNGHVLALYKKGEVLKEGAVPLPDMRYGLIFVFRTFDKVAYALVMRTRSPVQLLDSALKP